MDILFWSKVVKEKWVWGLGQRVGRVARLGRDKSNIVSCLSDTWLGGYQHVSVSEVFSVIINSLNSPRPDNIAYVFNLELNCYYRMLRDLSSLSFRL